MCFGISFVYLQGNKETAVTSLVISRLKASTFPRVRLGVLVKAKQWAFELHPIHLSRALSRLSREKAKNNRKLCHPSIDPCPIHRMLTNVLIS